MVTVKVLYFASIREITSKASEELSIESLNAETPICVKDCLNKIYSLYPELSDNSIKYSVALNMNYINDNAFVKEGDTLALLPPISGG